KGIPASLFMALGKSLYKSTALRLRDEIAQIMSEANREIARDNSEMLFITAFAVILDLRTGALTYCNAGHDAPILLAPNEAPGNLEGVGGPPLGIFDDTQYPGESVLIAPGATLVIITDGVTEAMTPDGELYGAERVRHRLATTQNDADAQTILETVYDDIKQYAQGAEPSDDITIMVVRWRGPNPNGC
ncbi:MAG: PP2C family protein-serine/threonine phosphatase, partial [Alphaproteobacteria bacterium]|nr:PP2C family protein-serine/threonine phosphatase [Alphaproteobacteria bacterium]